MSVACFFLTLPTLIFVFFWFANLNMFTYFEFYSSLGSHVCGSFSFSTGCGIPLLYSTIVSSTMQA
jgi:hypothetical protein